jgi:hypothetical protein
LQGIIIQLELGLQSKRYLYPYYTMLYFLVAFVAFCAFKQWNPMFGPQAATRYLADSSSCPPANSCPSTYHHHCYHHAQTSTMYDTFPSLDLTLDDNSFRSVLHLHYVAAVAADTHNLGCTAINLGHMTNNLGLTTHNPGCTMTHNLEHISQSKSYVLSMPYHLTAGYDITNKLFYPSCQCSRIFIMPDTCYEKTENWCSKSVTVPIYILLYHSDQQTDLTKLPEKYNCSALPLFLAINRSIYYLLNGTFSQAYDVNHLIKRLLLMFRQYITRRNDFKFLWFALLLTGILRSRHISLWFIFVLYLRIHIVPWKLFWFQKKIM